MSYRPRHLRPYFHHRYKRQGSARIALRIIPLLCALLITYGAQSPTRATAEPLPEPSPPTTEKALGQGWQALETAPDPGQPAPDPAGPLTLRDAVAATLIGNPDLAAFSWDVRTREAETIQAGLLPNPELVVELENLGAGSGTPAFEQAETTVALAQLIPIGGKRARNRRVAELDRDLSQWDYEAARLAVLTNATKAFVATLTAQRQLEILRQLESLTKQALQEMSSLVGAGGASPVEIRRARVDISVVRIRRQRAEAKLQASRNALAASWGSATPRFAEALGDLAALPPAPSLATLEQEAGQNPELARWDTELERHNAALSLEKSRRIPDPTVSLGGRHFNENGDSALVFSVAVPLPIFDRNQGNVLAATRSVSRAQAQRTSAELSVRSQIRQRYTDLAAAWDQAQSLRKETIPNAEKALAATTEGHRNGLFHFLEVINAERALFDLREQLASTLAEYHFARADLEQLTGKPFQATDDDEASP